MSETYALRFGTDEPYRLQLQSRIYAEHTDHLLRLAGIGGGMRVLDVGCGVGDVSLQLARLVGAGGSVVGVDADPAVLAVARERAREAGLGNVEFREAVLPDVALDGQVDAVVGRLILMHLPDPVEAVRRLATLVRPGGVVTFQDFVVSQARSAPAVPAYDAAVARIVSALRTGGADPTAGDSLAAVVRAAGLPLTGLAAAVPGGTGSTSPIVAEYAVATLAAVLPILLQAGVITPEEAGVDTLYDRIRAEAADATLYLSPLVGAWSRLPD